MSTKNNANPKHDDTATGSSSMAGNKRRHEDVAADDVEDVAADDVTAQDVAAQVHNVYQLRDKELQLLDKLLDKEKRLSNPTPARKPCFDQAPETEQDVFFSALHETTVDKGLVTFANRIQGCWDNSTVMYKRACYDQLCELIMDNFRKGPRERRQSVVVMGSPGTGTSFCGLYVLYDLVSKGKTVLYLSHSTGRGKGGSGYLYAPPDCPLLKLLREKGYDIPVSDPETNWVGVLKLGTGEGARFMHRFEMLSGAYVILDPSMEGIMVTDTHHCNLLAFSSPLKTSLINVKHNCLRRFMPLWSLDELKIANAVCSFGFDEELLCDRFKLFGGIARHVIGRVAVVDIARSRLNEAVRAVGWSTRDMLDPLSNGNRSGLLVHMVVPESLEKYETQVTSQRVLNEIARQAIDTQSLFLLSWIRQCLGFGCWSLDSEMSDLYLHRKLLHLYKGGWVWRELTETAVEDDEQIDTEMAKSDSCFSESVIVFRETNLTDLLCSWQVGHYCWPTMWNFPTLDSFAVVKGGSPFKPLEDVDEKQLSLIGFRTTIGQKPSLLVTGYKAVYEACVKRFNLDKALTIKLYLVWLVSDDNRASWKKKIKFTLNKGAADGENTSTSTKWFDTHVTQIVLSNSDG